MAPEDLVAELAQLEGAERALSARRAQLHDRMDVGSPELASRLERQASAQRLSLNRRVERQVSSERDVLHRRIDALRAQLGLPTHRR